jgi:hypothetical protein
MVWVIACFVDVLVLIVHQEVSLCVPATVLETAAEKVILPVPPLGQVHFCPPAVLGRGSALTPETHRVGAFRVRCHDVLDPNVVVPVVPEVILVQKPLAEAETKTRHHNLLWVTVKAPATIVGDAVRFPVDEKAMEMGVRPAHDELKDMVKLGERGVSANEKATPNEGTDAAQSNLELVNTSVW